MGEGGIVYEEKIASITMRINGLLSDGLRAQLYW